MTGAEQDDSESVAALGHVAGFLLPLLGPAVLLIVNRSGSTFVRAHLAASLVVSTAWLALAVLVISIDVGRLSVDEQQTSGFGLAGLLAIAGFTLVLIVLNVQRVKRYQLPVGWRRP